MSHINRFAWHYVSIAVVLVGAALHDTGFAPWGFIAVAYALAASSTTADTARAERDAARAEVARLKEDRK